MRAILVFFHCASNTGYAIRSYERSFLEMASRLVGDATGVHFAYSDLSRGRSAHSPENVIAFDPETDDPTELERIAAYVQSHDIDFAFGIDQPVSRPCFPVLRRAGVKTIVSYWGAPMSSIHQGIKLLMKRLEYGFRRHGPDHFVFESAAMARTATHGRGIPADKTSVVYLGVDPEVYAPEPRASGVLQDRLAIPPGRHVVFFSGHMEERKGVRVLVRAAVELAEARGRRDFHFLILGNQPGQERPFLDILAGTAAEEHVTFGGYRNDIPDLLPHCHVGAIASTGWDSFTVSALEMASAGLPLVVSDLQGLVETVDDGTTGFTFPPGDHRALADHLTFLFDHPEKRATMSEASRRRVLERFTVETQVAELVRICSTVDLHYAGTPAHSATGSLNA